jgi:hypothetical protein
VETAVAQGETDEGGARQVQVRVTPEGGAARTQVPGEDVLCSQPYLAFLHLDTVLGSNFRGGVARRWLSRRFVGHA